MESKLFHDHHVGIFVSLLPAFIPAVFFVLIGIIGNILTIKFFSKTSRPSVPWILIKYLAVTDLAVCIVAVPVCLEMVFNIQYKQAILCKMSHFLGNWTISSSAFILLTTGIDRYRKICHPLQRQIQMFTLKYFIFGSIFVCLLLSVRLLITFDSVEITITESANSSLKGYHCAAKCDGRFKHICLVFYVIDFVIILTGIVVILILYSRTIYTLFKRKSEICRSISSAQIVLKNRKTPERSSGKSVTNTSEIERAQIPDNNIKHITSRSEYSSTNLAFSADKNEMKLFTESTKNRSSADDKAEAFVIGEHNELERKSTPKASFKMCSMKKSFEWNVTFMVFTTTIVFLICFIPYFVIRVFIRLVLKSGGEYNFSPLIQFALKLPYLNSAFNPIVYSIFNVKFRRFISKCCNCRRK